MPTLGRNGPSQALVTLQRFCLNSLCHFKKTLFTGVNLKKYKLKSGLTCYLPADAMMDSGQSEDNDASLIDMR